MAGYKNNKPCRNFADGHCRYGDNCKFSHGNGQVERKHPPNGSKTAKPPLSISETELRAWRFAAHSNVALLTAQKLSHFFQQGQKLTIGEEAGVRQEVVKLLASEGGLQRIRQMVDQEYVYGSLQKTAVYSEQILPLFNILRHPEIMSSALMEEPVAVICGYLYGVEGQRLIKLYTLVIDVLTELSSDSQDLDAYFTASLQILAKIVDMKTEAQVNKNLYPIVNKLDGLIKKLTEGQEQPDIYEAMNFLARVQFRLGLGSDLPTSMPAHPSKTVRASFVMQRDPPGGRHSNDLAEIDEIQIMPTYDEVASTRMEYLPHNKPEENHLQGLDGLIDRHFRLLREDTVGQLRDAVKLELELFQHGRGFAGPGQKGARTYSYQNLAIECLIPDPKGRAGFKIEVSFDQPTQLSRKSMVERREWWLHSKRFEADALVCLVDSTGPVGTILFCTVEQNCKPKRDSNHVSHNSPEDTKTEEQFRAFYAFPERAAVSLILENPTTENVQTLLTLINRRTTQLKASLVEFPGILLPAFKPTLFALQQMKRSGDLPLSQILIPSAAIEEERVPVPPPAYTQKRGFCFNLKCLMNENNDLLLSPGQPFDINLLQTGSQLDEAQANALTNSLCRSLALIQGPPGTGKSFVGVALIRVLLANKRSIKSTTRTDIGPIFVVTYTNHALDQLLEHLHHAGIEQIVRIGSRSKSEVLQDCNLRSIARNEQRTKHEKQAVWRLHQERETVVEPQFQVLNLINNASSPTALKEFILLHWPEHHNELFGQIDNEGWTEVRYNKYKAPQNVIRTWLSQGHPSPVPPRNVKTLFISSLSGMSKGERYMLLNAWETRFQRDLAEKLLHAVTAHNDLKTRFDAVTEESDLRVLRAANVIGITTSGLARNLNMLRKLQSRVLICEEAGEVLEAHLLTTFLPSIEHAILIGDHQQLRPQIQNFDLSSANPRGEQYSLDISLFERLVHPMPGLQRLPYSTLETQRRMHPSISRLIRETLYPALKDAENVKEYSAVMGLRKRLYWLDHTEPEAGKQSEIDQTSHWNPYEVQMTAALVRHIVNQGTYRPDDIAVITPYLGQLHRLRNTLASSFAIVLGDRDVTDLENAGIEDRSPAIDLLTTPGPHAVSQTTLLRALRLATIDNFQGEEAKVIIVSLVRSNPQNKCGFLRTSNRINVALSRAKHGMFIIGNSRTASTSVQMWAQVTAMLTADGNLGPSLELQCPRHPDTIISITAPDDFPKHSPEGGCGLKCVDRLKCGHSCSSRCHSKILHDAVHCMEPCPRSLKGCDHSCPKYCGDLCPTKCQIDVFDSSRTIPCGHTAEHLPCWLSQDLNLVKCMAKVSHIIPGCGHEVDEFCHVNVDSHAYMCKVQCGANLPCGHSCLNQCKDCTTRTVDGANVVYDSQHGSCKQLCGRSYTSCNHFCAQLCHGDESCPPCQSRCANSCPHSQCGNLCSKPCRPCADEHCLSGCEHSRCTMPCSAPCNHVPCEKRCGKLLSCGHQCKFLYVTSLLNPNVFTGPSICGEACPPVNFCPTCTQDADIKGAMVDFLEGKTYTEIDLDATPCIFPPCAHFLTAESMDGQMSMREYYSINENDKIIGLKNTLSVPFSIDEIKRCAICRGSLRTIGRYGRLIRRAMLDEATKRFIVWSNAQYIPLVKALHDEQDLLSEKDDGKAIQFLAINGLILEGKPEQQIRLIRRLPGARYRPLLKLRQEIVSHCLAVDVEEQPFKRVLMSVLNPRRRREGIASDLDADDSLLQTRAGILAIALLIRCELAILSDIINLCQYASTDEAHGHFAFDFEKNKDLCEELVTSANASSNRLQEVEGHIFYAQYTALERQMSSSGNNHSNEVYQAAVTHIDAAKQLKELYGTTTSAVHSEIQSVEKMLKNGTFYEPVTSDEMRAVIAVMANEFQGTGHWYYCSMDTHSLSENAVCLCRLPNALSVVLQSAVKTIKLLKVLPMLQTLSISLAAWLSRDACFVTIQHNIFGLL